MNLTAMVAGVDRPTGSDAETDELYRFAKKFSEGATLVHTTRDPDEVRGEVQAALDDFDRLFLQPSIARRTALLEDLASGVITEDDLPRDVLTALLRHRAELDLDDDALRREVAFYLQAGSHSTADAFSHAADDWFRLVAARPGGRRPRPARPGPAPGLRLRDPATAPRESRRPAPGPRPDLSCGTGPRSRRARSSSSTSPRPTGTPRCSTTPRSTTPPAPSPPTSPAGGTPSAAACTPASGPSWRAGCRPAASSGTDPSHEQVLGTVTLMLDALLAAGGRPDPGAPPQRDPHSARDHFAAYPVVFGP